MLEPHSHRTLPVYAHVPLPLVFTHAFSTEEILIRGPGMVHLRGLFAPICIVFENYALDYCKTPAEIQNH